MRRRMTAALCGVAALAACTSGTPKPRAVVTVPIAGRPSAVTEAAGLVWVADDQRGVVVTLDENTGKVVGNPIKVGPSPIALAADARAVWVGDATGTLTRIDASTHRVNGPPLPLGGVLSGIAVGNGAVWVVDNEHGTLARVDPVTMHADLPVPMAQGAVRVAVDGTDVWVTNGDDTVTRVGAAPVSVGTGPIGVSARNGVAWVADSEDSTVSRAVVGFTGPTPSTPVAAAPVALAAAADGTWVLSQDARRLSRLDPRSGRVLRTTEIDTSPRGIALTTTRVWVVGVDPNVVIGVLRSALGGGA